MQSHDWQLTPTCAWVRWLCGRGLDSLPPSTDYDCTDSGTIWHHQQHKMAVLCLDYLSEFLCVGGSRNVSSIFTTVTGCTCLFWLQRSSAHFESLNRQKSIIVHLTHSLNVQTRYSLHQQGALMVTELCLTFPAWKRDWRRGRLCVCVWVSLPTCL